LSFLAMPTRELPAEVLVQICELGGEEATRALLVALVNDTRAPAIKDMLGFYLLQSRDKSKDFFLKHRGKASYSRHS
jgi:hypothetical protein